MFTLYDNRNQLWQWDINRKVIVEDNTIDQVHFCNRTSDCSLVVEPYYLEGNVYVADIPNILLQNDYPIKVYAYLSDGYTKVEECLKVKTRSKPADYFYTETEVLTATQLIKQTEELVATIPDKAQAAVQEAVTQNTELLDTVTIDVTHCKTETASVIEITDDLRRYVQSAIAGKDTLAFLKVSEETFSTTTQVRDLSTQFQVLLCGTLAYITGIEDSSDQYRFVVQITYHKESGSISAVAFRYPISEFATEEYVNKAIAGVEAGEVDLSGYYTKEETYSKAQVDAAIANIDIPEPDLTGYATEQYVDNAINNIDIPDTDLTNYYTKAETDTAIYNSKDAYYLDFSNATYDEQPATAEMIECVTRWIEGKNVCAHVNYGSSFSIRGYIPTTINGRTLKMGIQFIPAVIDPLLVNNQTPHDYYIVTFKENSNGELVYYVSQHYQFVLTTKEYVDDAIANGSSSGAARSVYYLDFSSATTEWQNAPAEMGEFVTRAATNHDVFAYISEKGSTWHFAQIKGLTDTSIILQIASITPNRSKVEKYYAYNITKNDGVWQYRIADIYSFRLATTDYVDTAIANIDIPAPTGNGVKIIRIPSTSSGYTAELTAELWQYLNEYYNNRPDGSPTVPDNVVFYIQSLSMPSCWVTASTVSGTISQYGNYLMLSGFESKDEKYCHQYIIYFNSDGSFQRLQTTYSAAAPASSGSDWKFTRNYSDLYNAKEIYLCYYSNVDGIGSCYLYSHVVLNNDVLGNKQYNYFPVTSPHSLDNQVSFWYYDGYDITFQNTYSGYLEWVAYKE